MNFKKNIEELAREKGRQEKIRVTMYVNKQVYEVFKERCEASSVVLSHVIEAFMEEFTGKKD